MPIYEYQSQDPATACAKCSSRFELIRRTEDDPLLFCPACGGRVTKRVSWCRSQVVSSNDTLARLEDRVKGYEKQSMWSHAAELADKGASKMNDEAMRDRAIDNYAKAGYALNTLEKHAQNSAQKQVSGA